MELLVVCAVLSMLTAISIPAVVRVRETVRRQQCQSNLHQLGIASQAHYASQQAFPYTSQVAARPPEMTLISSVSPLSGLLPYLDLADVYRKVDFNDGSPVVQGKGIWSVSTTNSELLNLGVSVFRCPSDNDHHGTNYRANIGPSPFVYWSAKERCPSPTLAPGQGAFVHDKKLRASEFEDGLSNTIFFSERVVGDGDSDRFDPWRDVFCTALAVNFCDSNQVRPYCAENVRADSAHDSWGGLTWIFGGWQHSWYHHLLPPNSDIPDCSSGCHVVAGGGVGLYTARSQHAGGVNAALGDGSARFIAEQIDLKIWRALSTRAGADNVDF